MVFVYIMDILPALDFEAVADNTGLDADDDPGEFVPCHFSDDEEETHEDGCSCALSDSG